MISYQLGQNNLITNTPNCINRSDGTSIPFAPDNTDYQMFKLQINNQTAQLEDANGVLMTPEQAIAYVATLP